MENKNAEKPRGDKEVICVICKMPIESDEESFAVPTAQNNQGDLADFVDVHKDCWDSIPPSKGTVPVHKLTF